MGGSHRIILPSGRMFDLQRLRSDGVLGPEEIEYCRNAEIPIGYDCLQCGWVALTCDDDLLAVLVQCIAQVKQAGIEFQFIIQAFFAALSIREVNVH